MKIAAEIPCHFFSCPIERDERRAWRLRGCVDRAAGKSAEAPNAPECKGANAARAQMARTLLTIQENELRDRRGARSAMRCNEILCVEKLERRAVARNLVRRRNQVIRRERQRGSVQHLADVAGRVWPIVGGQKTGAGA